MQFFKRKTSFLYVGLLVVLFFALLMIFFQRKQTQVQAKSSLLILREKLSLQDSKLKVLQILQKENPDGLDYFESSDTKDRIIVTTPLEFGATNWKLLIEFENAEVSSLLIRTSDNKAIKPKDAPNDINRDSKTRYSLLMTLYYNGSNLKNSVL